MNAQRRSSIPLPLRDFLRQESVAKQLGELREISHWRFAAAVALNYGLIAIAISAVLATASASRGGAVGTAGLIAVYAAAALLIAARQHALLVLLHEGAHRTISRNRALNDILSDLLCGAPLLVSTRNYRNAHLVHHQHLNSAQDPDWCRKVDDSNQRQHWTFPAQQPPWRLFAALYTQSVGYLLKSLIDYQNASPTQKQGTTAMQSMQPTNRQLSWAKYALYAGVAVALTLSASWVGFLLFWVMPMLLVLPMIMRIRSIAEHFALRHDHALSQSRSVRAGRLERLLIAPHHVGLHIDHHVLASVPFYNLPKLHELLLESSYYRQNAHLNDGYFLQPTGAEGKKATFVSDLYGPGSVRLAATAGMAAHSEAESALG